MHEARGVGCMEGMLVIEGSKKRNMKGQLELPLSTINKALSQFRLFGDLFPTLPSCNNMKSVLSRSISYMPMGHILSLDFHIGKTAS